MCLLGVALRNCSRVSVFKVDYFETAFKVFKMMINKEIYTTKMFFTYYYFWLFIKVDLYIELDELNIRKR